VSPLVIVYKDPRSLTASPSNARTHSEKQIRQIAQSIRSFGFNNPVLLDRDDKIIAGHGRVAAALVICLTSVPTVRLENLTPAQKRAYIIADNRLAELAGWDREILAVELRDLMETDFDFAISDIGFELPEIDFLLEERRAEGEADPEDDIGEMEDIPSIARRGDLWQLGDHLLFCGDALDPASFQVLMGSEKAEMVFADPPYNVPINGHVSGLGQIQHPEFIMASGEMSSSEFVEFLRQSSSLAAKASSDGSIHFICMDWRHLDQLFDASRTVYSELKNLCVWVKTNGGMGSLYRSQHEMVAVFKNGRGRHIARLSRKQARYQCCDQGCANSL
jgi:hypothetical protein